MSFKLGDRVILSHNIPLSDGRWLRSGVPCEVSAVFDDKSRYKIIYDAEIFVTVLSHEIELDKGYYRDITLNKLGI